MFACRQLDKDQSYHIYDTSIDCNSATYKAVRVIAVLLLLAMPVGIPVAFGFLLYKNREDLVAAPNEDERGMSLAVFKKTVVAIEPSSTYKESFLEGLYSTIDADSSGEVTVQELVQHVLSTGREQGHPAVLLTDTTSTTVCPASVSKITKAQEQEQDEDQEWWRGGPDEFSFLVKAFEPDYYCAHHFVSVCVIRHYRSTGTEPSLCDAKGLSWSISW